MAGMAPALVTGPSDNLLRVPNDTTFFASGLQAAMRALSADPIVVAARIKLSDGDVQNFNHMICTIGVCARHLQCTYGQRHRFDCEALRRFLILRHDRPHRVDFVGILITTREVMLTTAI